MLLGQCLRISFVCVEAELWLNIRVKIRFATYDNNFFSHTSVIHIMCVITSLVQLLNLDIVQFKSSWVIFGLWPFGPAWYRVFSFFVLIFYCYFIFWDFFPGRFATSGSMVRLSVPEIHCTQRQRQRHHSQFFKDNFPESNPFVTSILKMWKCFKCATWKSFASSLKKNRSSL